MTDTVQAHWLMLGAALVLLVLLGLWLFAGRSRPPHGRAHRPDVLDAGVAPARRNQALIDSPIAATIVPPAAIDAPSGAATAGSLAAPAAAVADNAEALAWEAAERAGEADPAGDGAEAAPDDLRKLKGVGPKLVTALHALGVTRYAQIAAWSEADIDRIDTQLGAFAGRIRRDDWVEQARLLAGGDVAGFEARFGKV